MEGEQLKEDYLVVGGVVEKDSQRWSQLNKGEVELRRARQVAEPT